MTEAADADGAALSDAVLAIRVCAVDPFSLGGIVVRGRAGPHRDRWLALLRAHLPPDMPLRRLPLHADDHRIFGGLDLTATLAAGQPVADRGVLAEADGGLLVLSMAERLPTSTAARLGAVLDTGRIDVSARGAASAFPARIGLVALDEGIEADERPAVALLDRLAFWIDLDGFDPATRPDAEAVARARLLLPAVRADEAILRALCETGAALGVDSLRAGLFALRAARAIAALGGRTVVAEQDAAQAARLVLSPRATRLPVEAASQATERDDPPPNAEPTEQRDAPSDDNHGEVRPQSPPDDIVLAAARAAIPPGLLERLIAGAARHAGTQAQGKAGAERMAGTRGRPAGFRAGKPGRGARLNVAATLRAAAPWQRLRTPLADPARHRVAIRGDDLRITRFKQRSETTTIFVVDASGSLAVARLAECKGAIELLLAECYVRRDQVALLAFRGQSAALLLPPTRSLARAKRCLADLPGGGATPLATAIDTATDLGVALRRRGQTPVIVFLTDGRANVARDGTTGRSTAAEDARLAALAAKSTGIRMLLVDAAPRPQPSARHLADAMSALYIALPSAEAGSLSRAVLAATSG